MDLNDWRRGTRYDVALAGEPIPDRFKLVLNRIGSARRILEVGCHTGHFSALLRAEGCHVIGVEVNSDAAGVARENVDELIVGDIEDPQLWDSVPAALDLILFMDVLEHLLDPWLALRRSRERLAPSGRVVASLPNVACWSIRRELLRGRFVPPDTGLHDPTHLRFFTLPEIRQLFEVTGYAVDSCTPLWTSVPFEHHLRVWPWLARRWREWWIARYPNLAIAVPLVEARPR